MKPKIINVEEKLPISEGILSNLMKMLYYKKLKQNIKKIEKEAYKKAETDQIYTAIKKLEKDLDDIAELQRKLRGNR